VNGARSKQKAITNALGATCPERSFSSFSTPPQLETEVSRKSCFVVLIRRSQDAEAGATELYDNSSHQAASDGAADGPTAEHRRDGAHRLPETASHPVARPAPGCLGVLCAPGALPRARYEPSRRTAAGGRCGAIAEDVPSLPPRR